MAGLGLEWANLPCFAFELQIVFMEESKGGGGAGVMAGILEERV